MVSVADQDRTTPGRVGLSGGYLCPSPVGRDPTMGGRVGGGVGGKDQTLLQTAPTAWVRHRGQHGPAGAGYSIWS